MSGKDKWVRRFSVDETAKHQNGFTIYKITSVLFPIDAPEAVTVVSVWKRYSEVRRLHRSMLALHAGLHLPPRGLCTLPSGSYFRRFTREVVEERARAVKRALEFVAEHRLLFTSTEFVNFLQSGHPAPAPAPALGAVESIRAALRLAPAPAPALPLARDGSPASTGTAQPESDRDEPDLASIPQIPIHSPAHVELRPPSPHPSADSLNSLDSLNDDLYDELSKITVETKSAVRKRPILPDLINFDAPSSSRFEDYHTMRQSRQSDTSSVSSRSNSRVSLYSKASLSNVESRTRTEDSYVFEAGYMLNMAARCEDARDYQRAFDYYKSGIEKMLVGVQTDSDPQRRALIKQKTNKYLSYAEEIYKIHLCGADDRLIPSPAPPPAHCPVPLAMLRRPYEDLALYRVLAVIADTMMLVLHQAEQACYAMKVIQKIPNNLTEFDEYFLQRTNETRQPVLPTSIPYMVPLHAYIETNSLIFLILTYAPGEKLLDYIKNYVKSAPTTPAREVNLENVFSEPLKKCDNSDVIASDGTEGGNEFEELVRNSQKLLQNVDRVLKEEKEEEREAEERGGEESPVHFRLPTRRPLPPAAVRGWAAQLLTALESLHNAGVICRDLNSSNILLGDGGHIILTYCAGLPPDVSRSRRSAAAASGRLEPGVAPELYAAGAQPADERLCDYWSFGAVLYELLCGVPLSQYHGRVFTSHTLLALPADLPVEEASLLTQLLTYEPAARLGRGGVAEIKRHPYFRRVDWRRLLRDWRVPGGTTTGRRHY